MDGLVSDLKFHLPRYISNQWHFSVRSALTKMIASPRVYLFAITITSIDRKVDGPITNSWMVYSLFIKTTVVEWLARPPAKQEVCGSNPASYLC